MSINGPRSGPGNVFAPYKWEGAILGVSAEISQISGVPGLDGFANLFLFLVE